MLDLGIGEPIVVKHNARRVKCTGDFERYTPPGIIEAARQALGGIELDPTSCEVANRVVKANRFFSIEDDGLRQDWIARSVWLNPPYANKLVSRFVGKLISEYEFGRVKSAVLLTNSNSTEVRWFELAASRSSLFCFPKRRLKFSSGKGREVTSPGLAQVLFYFGSDVVAFYEAFKHLGWFSHWVSGPDTRQDVLELLRAEGSRALWKM
jgi:hypothetical protein